MNYFTSLKNKNFYGVGLGFLIMALYSCGSSKQAYNSNDGIYGTPASNEAVVMVRDTKSDYYQNYFAGENELSQEIFTDIDAYEGYNDADTLYAENEYDNGNPPWEYSTSSVSINFNVGFGGYGPYGWAYGWNGFGYGWGYPGYFWGYPRYGWGYPGYGWGYPGYGWGYPGYGWGYPGYGWGYPGYGWGYYPPHYPGYPGYYRPGTYGKRYAHNTGRDATYQRFNTRNISPENKFNPARRSSSTRNLASSYDSNRYRTANRNSSSQIKNSRSYRQRSNYSRSNEGSNGYNKFGNNRSRNYNSRSSNYNSRSSAPAYRSGSSGYRGSSSGSRSSSRRREMSYNNVDYKLNPSNRRFVRKSNEVQSVGTNNRVSYSNARNRNAYQQFVKYTPSSGLKRNTGYSRSTSSYSKSSGSSSLSRSSGSGSPRSNVSRSTGTRSSGASRSFSSGGSSSRSSGSSGPKASGSSGRTKR